MADLIVVLDGSVAGTVTYRNDRLSFAYDDAWRGADTAYPLSLSMPLAARDHPDAAIRAFIWNLLPDNERTLGGWARQFQISARNPFALIGAVGEDCAGAVQFVHPDRVDDLIAAPGAPTAWLDDAEIGQRLRAVLDDGASGRTAADTGQFSLAGAQPKTALLRDGERWGVPSGRTPTTHILKPPARDMPGHAENEHFCLNLARAVGLNAARSEVRSFDGQLAIVVRRYDRARIGDGTDTIVRLHQEDMCQALSVLPWLKYQSDDGPTPAQILTLIREHANAPFDAGDQPGNPARDDESAFVDALIFNWLIGGTDAHAKNYGFLIGSEGVVRLAPLYDIASAFGLAGLQPQKMKLAMKIEYYHVDRVLPRHFARWGAAAGLDADQVVARVKALAMALPEALSDTAQALRRDGLDHPVIATLERILTERALKIAAM